MTPMYAAFRRYMLPLTTPMGTSRGPISIRTIYLVEIRNAAGKTGIGECSPIPGLSPDARPDFEQKLASVCIGINRGIPPLDINLKEWPAIRFGLEAALASLEGSKLGVLYNTAFTKGTGKITINGLIPMAASAQMLETVRKKSKAGFRCIKIKIGALPFDEEIDFLKEVRSLCSERDFELRLDANGAFTAATAISKIDQLQQFSIHSLEQPIPAGDWQALSAICRESPIPIALDEELIGIESEEQARQLLEQVRPGYLVLKPTLLGGFSAAKMWVDLAEESGTAWWAASILESSIGHSAITQWTSTLSHGQIQGLGSGLLFKRNFPTPVRLRRDNLHFRPDATPGHTRLKQLEPI